MGDVWIGEGGVSISNNNINNIDINNNTSSNSSYPPAHLRVSTWRAFFSNLFASVQRSSDFDYFGVAAIFVDGSATIANLDAMWDGKTHGDLGGGVEMDRMEENEHAGGNRIGSRMAMRSSILVPKNAVSHYDGPVYVLNYSQYLETPPSPPIFLEDSDRMRIQKQYTISNKTGHTESGVSYLDTQVDYRLRGNYAKSPTTQQTK